MRNMLRLPPSHVGRRINFDWLLAVAVVLFAFGFVYLRGQDKNWDLLNYHYFTGFSLLNGNFLLDIAPVGLVSFLNPTSNVLAFLALSELSFPASAWALTLVQLLALPLLVLIGRQLGRELGWAQVGLAEGLALALCLLAPMWWSEMGTTFADSSTAPLVLLGVYLGLRGVAEGVQTRKVLLFSGIFFGLAVGLKLTNATFAIGFLGAFLGVAVRYRWQGALRLLLALCFGMVLGLLLTAWWNWYLFERWGSPLFPLYNGWFKSPHADLVNFRDLRWQFESIPDFAEFLWRGVNGTLRTAEFAFADPRMLIFAVLASVALVASVRAGGMSRGALLFLLFLVFSFVLWAKVFAYQRYLIPIEVLLGFGIWIALSRLTARRGLVTFMLALGVMASAALIKVPDWGHSPAPRTPSNAFGLNLPDRMADTPARYLVHGNAISYLLPFLHRDSRFYGVGSAYAFFTKQIESEVQVAVTHANALPLRILLRQEAAAGKLWKILSPFGFAPDQTGLSCAHFRSDIDVYVICEIQNAPQLGQKTLAPITLDFQDGNQMLPPALLGLEGLSFHEPWGRWSDGDAVKLAFANCLPQGRFKIDLRGHAFGPNAGQAVKVALGASEATMVFGAEDSDQSVTLDNTATCQNSLTLSVPHKISPSALGLSTDSRTIGVGLVRFGIAQQNP